MNRAYVRDSIPKERDGPHWGGAFAPETNRPAQACPQGLGWALARSFCRVGRALLENLTELPQAEIISLGCRPSWQAATALSTGRVRLGNPDQSLRVGKGTH